MTEQELATRVRHYGLDSVAFAAVLRDERGVADQLAGEVHAIGIHAIKAAADIEAVSSHRLPVYEPTGPVCDGVEVMTARLACCGAGSDQRDERTGQRLHMPGCRTLGLAGVAHARHILDEATR